MKIGCFPAGTALSIVYDDNRQYIGQPRDGRPAQFNALTGLTQQEFMVLLHYFGPLCDQYYRYHDLQSEALKMVRYRAATVKNEVIAAAAAIACRDQLINYFLLAYMNLITERENPNQAYQGVIFGMSQGKVSLRVTQLSSLLQTAVKRMDKLPKREVRQLYAYLSS